MAVATPLSRLDALGTAGPYRSRALEYVHDVTGNRVAELSLVPWLFAQREIRALRRAEPPEPARRQELLAKAGQLFTHGVVGGVPAEDYRRTVAAVAGLPLSAVREATGR